MNKEKFVHSFFMFAIGFAMIAFIISMFVIPTYTTIKEITGCVDSGGVWYNCKPNECNQEGYFFCRCESGCVKWF